ncbi:hypothetical protein C8Q77DRAFT_1087476 [Trametes polyzona]|nr:hypothetical protein C8Q77DRAFT_1087476 [Trametes polyzona]
MSGTPIDLDRHGVSQVPVYDTGGSRGAETRTEEELEWVRRYDYLVSRGYRLRSRYRPNWVPSWAGSSEPGAWMGAEDALLLPVRKCVIDAIRTTHGKTESLVYIKKVRQGSSESSITDYLNSDELRNDPRNCTVPVVDRFPDPIDSDACLLVMPFLRYIDSPDFANVEDVLQCGKTLLEGLVFLHQHRIAHRDCGYKNIMMDASELYPQGHHPILLDDLPDVSKRAPVLYHARSKVKYYFIDFGISSKNQTTVTGRDSTDKTVPEFSDHVPYDPFKVDIYLLGNVFTKCFLKFRNLDIVEPLVARMKQHKPSDRPTAQEVFEEWQAIAARTSAISQAWRVQPRDESLAGRAIRDAVYGVSAVVGVRHST